MKPKLVLIGNGMAGMKTVDELLAIEPDKYDITVFGSEPYGNYNRIMLSPVLAGDKQIDDIIIHTLDWYRDNNITLHTSKTVVSIDPQNQTVQADDGTAVAYDKLIIATGSVPFLLPIPGADLEGVISFRDISDVTMMIETAKTHKKAVVIGGGLLGLEAANGLMIQGMDVTVVHRSETLMNMQLDQAASDLMQHELEQKGIKFLMNHDTAEYVGRDRVEKLRFSDGSEVEADLVVVAAGIRPNIQLAKDSGIHCERGILVDDTMKTFSPNIYSVGECVQFQNQTFGLVAPLYDQAKICANQLANNGLEKYSVRPTATMLKVTGINLFSAGDFIGDDGTETLVLKDFSRHVYKKLVLRDNVIVGALLYGETSDGNWYFSHILEQTDITNMRESILFGQLHFDAA
jgi:nitrite reductase (NADH) large subunit